MIARIARLALLPLLLLLAAWLPRGGGSPSSCVFLGSTTNGSCISAANETQFFQLRATDNETHYAVYGPNNPVCGSTSPNCLNLEFNTPPDTIWVQFPYTQLAYLCSPQEGGALADFSRTAISASYANVWWMIYDTGGGTELYQVGPTCTSGAERLFANNTTAGSYASLPDLCAGSGRIGPSNGINPGDQLEIKRQPGGIPYWSDQGCVVTTANLTLTFDSGTNAFSMQADGGVGGTIAGKAGNLTINGAGATLGFTTAQAVITQEFGNANITVQGTSGTQMVVDCGALHGQPLSGQDTDGVFTGHSVGLVTINYVTIQNCGGSVGDTHAIYESWGPLSSATALDGNYCHSSTGVIVKDASGDTVAVKWDDQCSATLQSLTTKMQVYCTIEGTAGPNCDANEMIGFQCGGNHLVTDSYFEMYGQGTGSDQVYFSKASWGANTGATNGCPVNTPPLVPPKNAVHFDKAIFVMDGVASSTTTVTVFCGSAFDGNDCNANASGHVAGCITNSQIVGNFTGNPTPMRLGPGVFTDAGCTGSGPDTNTYFALNGAGGRAAVCSQTNWSSGSGTSCAWPFVPLLLSEGDFDHNTQVQVAQASGKCGSGTITDPITVCEVRPEMAFLPSL